MFIKGVWKNYKGVTTMDYNIGKDLGRAYADGQKQGVKDFAKMLIDKSKNGTVAISDLPDLVKE